MNGDGENSRDDARGQVYNVAVGERTTLNDLYGLLANGLSASHPHVGKASPVYRDFRPGDVRHSLADIGKAAAFLGYRPTHRLGEGLREALPWYVRHLGDRSAL